MRAHLLFPLKVSFESSVKVNFRREISGLIDILQDLYGAKIRNIIDGHRPLLPWFGYFRLKLCEKVCITNLAKMTTYYMCYIQEHMPYFLYATFMRIIHHFYTSKVLKTHM